MAVALTRALYTHHKRSKNDFPFAIASTAFPPSYSKADNGIACETLGGSHVDPTVTPLDEKHEVIISAESGSENDVDITTPVNAIAMLPQYFSIQPTTLIMKEEPLSFPSGAFKITDATTGEHILDVKVAGASLSHRKHVYDANSNTELFNIRHVIGSLPQSYLFEDPQIEQKLVDLQGHFYRLSNGSMASASFINPATGKTNTLVMRGSPSLHQRHTIIDQHTGTVVASIERPVLTPRNLVAGEQTNFLRIESGVDISLIVGMIVGLDERMG